VGSAPLINAHLIRQRCRYESILIRKEIPIFKNEYNAVAASGNCG
jgi:hypothetical protein